HRIMRRQPSGDLRVRSSLRRRVVTLLRPEIILFYVTPLVVVGVLVPLAVSESLRALVMRVAQMLRNRDRSPLADVGHRAPDCHGTGVGFGCGRHVNRGLT